MSTHLRGCGIHSLGAAEHPSACSHPGVSPQSRPALKAELLAGNQMGTQGGEGQEGMGTIAVRSVMLFSFCVPRRTGSGDIDGLPKVSELQSVCGPPFLSTGVPV